MTRKPIASKRHHQAQHSWPTPEELEEAPELAVLALLDANLEIALRALVSAHPQLADPDRPAWTLDHSPSGRAAENFLARAKGLHRTLETYRDAVALGRNTFLDDNDF
jgi:hypothetical protein